MLLVGLTGGIGSGKSTVSALLRERGAVVVDADAITRELQQPGHPVFDAMVERFGPGIVAADGTLDRAAVASIVFTDEQARKDLEAIVHPAVGAEMIRQLQEHAGTDHVVIYDVPLLVESRQEGLRRRARRRRRPRASPCSGSSSTAGFGEADARNRIANQVSRERAAGGRRPGHRQQRHRRRPRRRRSTRCGRGWSSARPRRGTDAAAHPQ